MEFKQNYLINIKDYKIREKVEAGGFGSVYSVQNKYTNEILAAKVATGGSQNLKMINREIKIMIHFNHPTIAKLIGYSNKDFWDNSVATIFMKFEKHGSLRKAIKSASKGRSFENYNNTARQIILIGIAYGMMVLHKNHVIHRDLKPENALLDDNLHPLISDFGLSKFYDVGHSLNQSLQQGTLIYMAPEILSGENFDTKADVYAFGILMYEVITEKHPYPEILSGKMNIINFTKSICENNHRPELDKDIKKSFQKLLTSCWSKDPSERPTFEQIFNKLAYNFDDFIVNDDDDDDDKDKYYLPDVDKDEIEDYLNEIESKNVDLNDLPIEAINSKLEKIEEKIENNDNKHDNENKKLLDQFIELNKTQNENFCLLQKENNELMKKFDSLLKDNNRLNHELNCMKHEVTKLKESSFDNPSSASIPDDLLDRLSDAEKRIDDSDDKFDMTSRRQQSTQS